MVAVHIILQWHTYRIEVGRGWSKS